MDNKIGDKLAIIVSIMLIFMGIILWKQNKTINEYQDIINNADTAVVIKHDTIYTDVDTTVTQPIIIKETIIRVDTLYNDEGDSILVKKKSKLIQIQ